MADQRFTPATLDEALLYVQANRPKVVKSSLAEVETRGGGFTYTFADLAAVADAVLPMLSDLGVLWSTWIDTVFIDGQPPRRVLNWRIVHVASQTERSGVWPLVGDTPQAVGGAVTYGRRHCLVTVTGLTPQDDDDAIAAEAERAAEHSANRGTARRAQADRRRPAPTGGTAQRAQRPAAGRPALPTETREISRPQIDKIRLGLDEFGITDRADKVELVGLLAGRRVASSTELTMAEARTVIDAMEQARTNPDPGGALWQAATAAQAARDEQAASDEQHAAQAERDANEPPDGGQ